MNKTDTTTCTEGNHYQVACPQSPRWASCLVPASVSHSTFPRGDTGMLHYQVTNIIITSSKHQLPLINTEPVMSSLWSHAQRTRSCHPKPLGKSPQPGSPISGEENQRFSLSLLMVSTKGSSIADHRTRTPITAQLSWSLHPVSLQ